MEDRNNQRPRKRKIEDTENKAAMLIDNDDEKVEEFFALIRSTREVRDRLRSKDHQNQDQEQDHRNNKKNSSIVGVWNPTFRPEDFIDLVDHDRDDHDRHKVYLGGTSGQSPPKMEVEKNKLVSTDGNNSNSNKNINTITNLDLKLSL